MSLLDTLMGRPPTEYDPDDDELAKVDPLEIRSAPFAARRNAQRHIAAMKAASAAAQEVSGIRRLLVIIIGILVGSKAIDITLLAGAFGP